MVIPFLVDGRAVQRAVALEPAGATICKDGSGWLLLAVCNEPDLKGTVTIAYSLSLARLRAVEHVMNTTLSVVPGPYSRVVHQLPNS
ncbi:hypothetical protein CUJ84_Chr003625 [Rhizobium leguminosarum]|uniref:Uncharacterized protein n=1 Tax=Rhizobium leguminosarum TaxID=384 RepID=A0A2K9Z6V1_RHILE|nr:hypothetical protein CUJ84_Chr003625 [Rhizobium leguminosarum]